MDARFTLLFDAIRRANDHEPAGLAHYLTHLPEVESLPSPWETWTLIGLVRHRQRQLWVAEIISTRLQCSPAILARIGALNLRNGIPQCGCVPGMPEWQYYFHGQACCFTHKVDGDDIDVTFWDDSAEYFDIYFYQRYLESLRRPEPPEVRLRDLHRSTRAVTAVIPDMIAAGALTALSDEDFHPFRIADAVLEDADAISAFCRAWAVPEQRVWLAALIGDWLTANEAVAGQPELAAVTGPRAEQCRKIRQSRLRRQLGDEDLAGDALAALSNLGSADLDQCLENALRGPPSELTVAALDIIVRQDNRRWCPAVYEFFRRTSRDWQPPHSYLWINS